MKVQTRFKSVNLQNFKSHQNLQVNFGEVTEITGDNAKGKSSILEALTWVLYGTDTLGSKLDPAPVTYDADETLVELLLNHDGKDLLLGRELKNGKTKYIINEVPSKATEFNEILVQLFDKDLFLSLFNPNYFYTLHWEKQREMILSYVMAPANKEVLKELPEAQSNKLSDLVKKHSLDDLEKIHRDNKKKLDKQYIAAQSRTKTLKEQYEDSAPKVPLSSLRSEIAVIDRQIKDIEKVTTNADETNSKFNSVQSKLNALNDQVSFSKEQWPRIRDEAIEETCRTCKQPLDEESIKAVEADKEKRKSEYKTKHTQLVKERDQLKEQLKELEYIDVSEQHAKIRELEGKKFPIEQEIHNFNRFEALKEQVEQAEKDEKEKLESLNESIFIIDSIKAFRAKEAELQAEKVQALFENLTIKLFETLKTTGEVKPTFEIEMDGKGYKKLSLSESIRAGLELRDVLSDQSELITPCFVDNAESITKFKQPNGQLIISRVVAGKDLSIEVKE